MTFSPEWEQNYAAKTHLSIWPWSDLVSYMHRYAPIDAKPSLSILELGCGFGANIPFFKHINADYHSIDGSSTAVNSLRNKYPDYAPNILLGDFSVSIPFNKLFDVVVDRASLICNNHESIKNTISACYEKLEPGGLFVGIDWYSVEHSEFTNGKYSEDPFTRCDFKDGIFKNTGKVHFYNHEELQKVFRDFEFVILEHKLVEQKLPNSSYKFAAWNFVARKSS